MANLFETYEDWVEHQRACREADRQYIRGLAMTDDQLSRYSETIGAIHARFNAVMKRNEQNKIGRKAWTIEVRTI